MTNPTNIERIQVGRVYLILTPKSPKWQIEWCQDGKQIRQTTKTTSKKQAMTIAREYDAKLVLGQLEGPKTRRNDKLVDVIEKRINYLRGQKPCEKSITNYRRAYEQLLYWARGQLGREPTLGDLNTEALHEFENTLRNDGAMVRDGRRNRRQGKSNGPGTLRGKMIAVRGLIRWAANYGLIAKDPSSNFNLPPIYVPKTQAYTPDEIAGILGDPDQNLRDIWIMFLRTGLRSEELTWLTKGDVDIAKGFIHVRKKTCPYTGVAWSPKHGHERIVPVADPDVLVALDRQMKRSTTEWVFGTGDNWRGNSGRWRNGRLLNRLKVQLRRAGITHGTLHTCRHTFISFLANTSTVPIVQVKEIVGHNDLDTTMKYVHVKPADIAGTLAQVDLREMSVRKEVLNAENEESSN